MRIQRFTWSCGPAAVVNAFKRFGIHLNEHTVMGVAGTVPPSKCTHCRNLEEFYKRTSCKCRKCPVCREERRLKRVYCSSGTEEKGVLQAVRHFGAEYLTASEYGSASRNNAFQWLRGVLLQGRAVIMCIDSWNHWVVALSMSGDDIMIFDSGQSYKNVRENGVFFLNKTDLMRRWYNSRRWCKDPKKLYAISIRKK